jgi:hypothetical protein
MSMKLTITSGIVVYIVLTLGLTGCGGGGDSAPAGDEQPPADPAKTEITLSGVVQKGPFTSLKLTAFLVDNATAIIGDGIQAQAIDQNFNVAVPASSPVLLKATGTFANDLTGQTITVKEPLQALVAPQTNDATTNVNALTDFSAQKTLAQFSPDSTLDQQLQLSNQFVLDAFGITGTVDPSTLRLDQIDTQATINDPNVQLLLLSALLLLDQPDSDPLKLFNDLGDQFANAQTLNDIQTALGFFNGSNAQSLYDQIVSQGAISGLPPLTFPQAPGWSCSPDSGCGWVTLPAKTLSISSNVAYEADGQVELVVRLSEASTTNVYFTLISEDDSAINQDDFVGINQQFTFFPGELEKRIIIPVVVDNEVEQQERFRVTLEPKTVDYTVFNNVNQVDVLINDGAPDLNNSIEKDITIKRFCIRGIDSPGVNTNDDCTAKLPLTVAVTGSNNTALAVEIDLQADCTDPSACDALLEDRLVELYLLATDVMGAPQLENRLGEYRYALSDIQLSSDDAISNLFYLAVDDASSTDLMLQAMTMGWQLRLEARVKEQGDTATAQLSELIPIPEELIAGDRNVGITGAVTVANGASYGCQAGHYAITADFEISLGQTVNGTVCAEINSTGTGVSAVLTDNTQLDKDLDISFTPLIMPEKHTVLFGYGDQYPNSQGLPIAPYLSATDSNGSSFPQNLRIWLHSEGLPFLYRISSASLTSSGVKVAYDKVRYVMAMAYSASDPRGVEGTITEGIKSNDMPYYGVNDQPGTLILADDGIKTTVQINQSTGHTAYPKGRLAWDGFTQTVEKGLISNKASLTSALAVSQSSACQEASCNAEKLLTYFAKADDTNAATKLTLDTRGALLGEVETQIDVTPSWGAQSDTVFAYQRPGDLPVGSKMGLFYPGYRLSMTEDQLVTDYLQAHAKEDAAEQQHQLFTAGSEAFIKGNFYPSGLSVGPLIYSDTEGQPDVGIGSNLSAKPLRIDNQIDVLNLNTSRATKYVVRNSGITGVFNIDTQALNTPVSVYGYDLSLNRFAIRQVDNKIDTYNWVDGHMQIAGDADLDIYFENLQIDCSANLLQGNLTYEYCDQLDDNSNGVIDENCNQRLTSWSADTEIFGMSFANADGSTTQACQAAGAQVLSLQHEVDIKALDKPVGLLARWSPAGDLLGQNLSLQDSYRFDYQDGQVDSGFPLQLTSGNFGVTDITVPTPRRYGWLELESAKVAVPFWQALDTDIRLVNELKGEPVAEASVVANAGAFASNSAQLGQLNKTLQQAFIDDPASHIWSQYQWGDTGVGFSLPVYFTPSSFNDDKQTRFIGRKWERDLFVLSANAGIDFIEPVRTKLSFGASADIAKLKSIRFQVDLDDPENLAQVDSFLQSIGVSNKPILEPAFSGLQQRMNVFNKFANQSIDYLIEQGIDKSVKKLGQASASLTPSGKDPFVTMSESLAQIHNLPQQVNLFLDDEIRSPIDDVLLAIENELTAPLQAVVNQVSTINAGSVMPTETSNAIAQAQSLISRATMHAENITAEIDNSITQAEQLIAQINQPVTELNDAVSRVRFILEQSTNVIESECLNPAISSPERSGYLEQVEVNLNSITEILKLLEGGNIFVPLVELIADDPQIAQRLESSQQAIKRRAEVLAGHVATAETAIRNQVCSGDLVALLSNVNILLGDLGSSAATVSTELSNLKATLSVWSELKTRLINEVVKPLNELEQKLAGLENVIANGKSGALALSEAGLPASGIEVATLTADIRETAQQRIGEVYVDAQGILTTLLASQLPGAHYTPEQLRLMLVKKVVATAPVVSVRNELNKHMAEINKQLNDLAIEATDQINVVVRTAVAKVESGVNDVLEAATAPVKNIPLNSASLDGYGVVAGNELERFHLGAEWTMAPAEEGKPGDSFAAALDVVSQNANNEVAGCSIPAGQSLLDARISAFNMGGKIVGSEITLKEIFLGFTLEAGGGSIQPKGVFGGLDIIGNIGFSEFIIYDPGFRAGIGANETYIGARAGAVFSELQAEVAFLAGKTCNTNILLELDPDVAQFIDVPDTGFLGAYVRGGATVPIWTSGCTLTVSLSADFGGWVLDGSPSVVGGLVGGGATGEALCIASLKGKVTTILQKTGNDISFVGNGFGIAGGGSCEKETWTTVNRSRDDDWCGTGDAQFGAKYSDGWSIYQLETSSVH